MTHAYETRPLDAAGLGETSFCRCDSPEDNRQQPHLSSADHAQSRARLKFLACRLHELGAKPLVHFLDEVERGEPLRAHLEAYARLPVAFIKANGGDKFPAPFHLVEDVDQ